MTNYSSKGRIGLAFPGQPYSLREVVAAAQTAEKYGFESIWIAEDLWTGRDAVSVVSCLAFATTRIHVGTAVVNPYTRHPVLTAMTVNTLLELAGDRLRIGIGSGLPWKALVEQQMAAKPPLHAMREAVETMRTLLSGGRVSFGDETVSFRVNRKCFQGAMEPRSHAVPIYMGASGPRMTELAGEIGDGLLLGTGTSPDEAAARLNNLITGAARVGRDPHTVDVGALVVTSCSEAGDIHPNALAYAAKCVAQLNAPADFDPHRVRRVQEAYDGGDCERAVSALSREMINRFTIAGSPVECLRTLNTYVRAGVKLPILLPFGGDLESILQLGKQYVLKKG